MSAAIHHKTKKAKYKKSVIKNTPPSPVGTVRRYSWLASLWRFNFILLVSYFILSSGVPFLQSSVLEYSNVSGDPFDGTIAPIAYVPNWMETKNTNKSLTFAEIDMSQFKELPTYDIATLENNDTKDLNALQTRYTYPVVYMGSYRGNYKEYDGSHLGIDIRAPIGTPVLAIANGVVIKVQSEDSSDGKYIVIRHENVTIGGKIETIYSSYLHLSEIIVEAGQKISKGSVIGKVGMTGITTTPHLHFQIDTKDAPYHPYWPYSYLDAQKAGVDFFEAINIGLGKDNAKKYTIHPMDFVQSNLAPKYLSLTSTPVETPVQATTTIVTPNTPTVVLAQKITEPTPVPVANTGSETPSIVLTNISSIAITPEIIPSPIAPTVVTNPISATPPSTPAIPDPDPIATIEQASSTLSGVTTPTPTLADDKPIFSPTPGENTLDENIGDVIFHDIALNSYYYNASRYLYTQQISAGYEDGTFRPELAVTRAEALAMIERFFHINASKVGINKFRDTANTSWINPYLDAALERKIISKNNYFRPNTTITRAEFVTMLMRASWLVINKKLTNMFQDLSKYSPHTIFINNFTNYLGVRGRTFEPNKNITRGDVANIIYAFSRKYK